MTITSPVYARREDVKRALDIMDTARANDQVDRLLQSSSRTIEGDLNRVFYPRVATKRWDWLSLQSPTPWRLWLDDKELITVSSFSSGGQPIVNYFLYPDTGPPYNRIEIDISSQSAFTLANTFQKSISLVGTWGYALDLTSVGTLGTSLSSGALTFDVPNGSLVGVGDLLTIDLEYALVVGRGWIDSTQVLQVPLTASSSAIGVVVTDGSQFFTGETIALDTEQCWIVDIIGNTLTVKRAWDGSVLASHTGSAVYVSRSVTVARGVVGSAAVSHLSGATVFRWNSPALVNQRCIAETLSALEQEKGAYARVIGSGDNQMEARGAALSDVREMSYTVYGRKNRSRAV